MMMCGSISPPSSSLAALALRPAKPADVAELLLNRT
jgi:hypothetical protein